MTTAGLVILMTAMARAQTGEPPVPAVAHKPVTTKPAGTTVAKPTVSPAKPAAAPAASLVPLNRKVIVLDPAHGGIDSGSQITDSALEKDVTLAIAYRLRSLLTARGFTVVMTRDAEGPAVPGSTGAALSLDDRAGIANHAHAAACLVLHATKSGTGVHLYRSELEGSAGQPNLVPWLTAQAAWISQSQSLEKQVASAFTRSGIAMVASKASIRPMDSLACPALVVEVAPSNDDDDSISDTDYQQRVALALAGAMLAWQDQVQPPVRIVVAPSAAATTAGSSDTTGAQP